MEVYGVGACYGRDECATYMIELGLTLGSSKERFIQPHSHQNAGQGSYQIQYRFQ